MPAGVEMALQPWAQARVTRSSRDCADHFRAGRGRGRDSRENGLKRLWENSRLVAATIVESGRYRMSSEKHAIDETMAEGAQPAMHHTPDHRAWRPDRVAGRAVTPSDVSIAFSPIHSAAARP